MIAKTMFWDVYPFYGHVKDYVVDFSPWRLKDELFFQKKNSSE